MDSYLQPRPWEELREAAGQLAAFWRAEAPRHTQGQQCTIAGTCCGVLEQTYELLGTVGGFLEAARRPGGTDEQWFEDIAEYLEG